MVKRITTTGLCVFSSIAALGFLFSASGFGQEAPNPQKPVTALQPIWMFELPFEPCNLTGSDEPDLWYNMSDCNGDGVRDVALLARPRKGFLAADRELFCFEGATGVPLWHVTLAGSKAMILGGWVGHNLVLKGAAKKQLVVDLRTGKMRGDWPALMPQGYLTELVVFDREWPWGDEALVTDYYFHQKRIMRANYLRIPTAADSPTTSYLLNEDCPGAFTPTKAVLNTPEALVCLERSSGKILWKLPYEKGTGSAFLQADETHVAVGRMNPNRLSLLSVETGEEVWSVPLLGSLRDAYSYLAQPILTSLHVVCYQGINQGVVVVSRATGQKIWEARAFTPCWFFPIGDDLFGLRENSRFRIFKIAGGEPLLDLPLKKVQSLQEEGRRLFLISRPEDRICAVDLDSLKIIWDKDVPMARGWVSIPTPMVCDKDGTHLIGYCRQKVLLLDGKTGAELGQMSYEEYEPLRPLPGRQRFLEYLGGADLRCKTAEESFKTKAVPKELGYPMLAADSSRVFAIDGRTLRMLPLPCPVSEEEAQDELLNYLPFYRQRDEYTSTWAP